MPTQRQRWERTARLQREWEWRHKAPAIRTRKHTNTVKPRLTLATDRKAHSIQPVMSANRKDRRIVTWDVFVGNIICTTTFAKVQLKKGSKMYIIRYKYYPEESGIWSEVQLGRTLSELGQLLWTSWSQSIMWYSSSQPGVWAWW